MVSFIKDERCLVVRSEQKKVNIAEVKKIIDQLAAETSYPPMILFSFVGDQQLSRDALKYLTREFVSRLDRRQTKVAIMGSDEIIQTVKMEGLGNIIKSFSISIAPEIAGAPGKGTPHPKAQADTGDFPFNFSRMTETEVLRFCGYEMRLMEKATDLSLLSRSNLFHSFCEINSSSFHGYVVLSLSDKILHNGASHFFKMKGTAEQYPGIINELFNVLGGKIKIHYKEYLNMDLKFSIPKAFDEQVASMVHNGANTTLCYAGEDGGVYIHYFIKI